MADKLDMAVRSALPWSSVLVACVLVAGACTNQPPDYPYAGEPNPLELEYVLDVGDTVHINVWKHDDFSVTAPIRPDGAVTVPLIGEVKAAGKTPTQLRDDVRKRLEAYVKLDEKNSVTVSVTAINSYFITVVGSVENPGRFTAPRYLTVSEAVALAGGPNRFAVPDEAFILRVEASGALRKIPINYQQVERGIFPEQNLYLLRGDRVVIP
jgi:polysaccharide export outer membrane protein